jgi:hypothetical protein
VTSSRENREDPRRSDRERVPSRSIAPKMLKRNHDRLESSPGSSDSEGSGGGGGETTSPKRCLKLRHFRQQRVGGGRHRGALPWVSFFATVERRRRRRQRRRRVSKGACFFFDIICRSGRYGALADVLGDDCCAVCRETTLEPGGLALPNVLVCQCCFNENHLDCSPLRQMPAKVEHFHCSRCVGLLSTLNMPELIGRPVDGEAHPAAQSRNGDNSLMIDLALILGECPLVGPLLRTRKLRVVLTLGQSRVDRRRGKTLEETTLPRGAKAGVRLLPTGAGTVEEAKLDGVVFETEPRDIRYVIENGAMTLVAHAGKSGHINLMTGASRNRHAACIVAADDAGLCSTKITFWTKKVGGHRVEKPGSSHFVMCAEFTSRVRIDNFLTDAKFYREDERQSRDDAKKDAIKRRHAQKYKDLSEAVGRFVETQPAGTVVSWEVTWETSEDTVLNPEKLYLKVSATLEGGIQRTMHEIPFMTDPNCLLDNGGLELRAVDALPLIFVLAAAQDEHEDATPRARPAASR